MNGNNSSNGVDARLDSLENSKNSKSNGNRPQSMYYNSKISTPQRIIIDKTNTKKTR